MSSCLPFLRLLKFVALLSFSSSLGQTALPACSYEDQLTKHQTLDAWQFSLLDPIFKLPAEYKPDDLRPLSQAGFKDERLVRAFLIDDLGALQRDASAAGFPLGIQSAYRSYEYQQETFAYWVEREGQEAALKSSARAGHSEHQLGTVLDFKTQDGAAPWSVEDWASTPTGAWLAANAWHYGFVMSYPKGKEAITCYIYEPWHYRYVGKDLAKILKESDLTLREWLWLNQ